MSAPKIGLLCGDLDATRDGVADYAGRLAAHLAAIGLDPLLLTTYQLADATGGGTVGVTDSWGSAGIAAAVRVIRRLSLDVLHVQFAPSAYRFSRSVGLVPLMVGRRLPLVVTLHEYGVWAERQPARRMLVGPLWSMAERRGWLDREALLLTVRCDRVVVTNSGHAAVLVRRLPGRRAAVTEVPIGPNIEVAPADRAEVRRAVRRQVGAEDEAPLVIFFGFLHPVKGLERLIDAAAALRGAHPTLRLVLAGGDESHSVSGPEAHALRRTLQDAARRQGMGGQLVIPGYLPGAQVSRLLQAADVAVFPFDHGVIMDKSGAVLAALSHGVPTIATPSKVDHSQTDGDPAVLWVWPPDGPALADAIDRVLTEPTLADRLRRAGSAEVERHQWPQIAARHARLYHDVVEQAAARTRPWPGTAESTTLGRPRPTAAVAVAADNETAAGPAPCPASGSDSRPGMPSPRPARSASVLLMSGLDQVLRRLLAPTVRSLIQEALVEQSRSGPDGHDPELFHAIVYPDPGRLHVDPTAVLNNALFNVSSGDITIGPYAFFGHNVSLLTGTHDFHTFGAERQLAVPKAGRDIVIGEGVWLSSNVIVVGPCTIGAHAVVGVASLVLHDVEPYTVVAGSPATLRSTIPRPDEAAASP